MKPGKRIVLSVLICSMALFTLAVIKTASAAEHDGVVMQDGKPLMLQDGKPGPPLDHEMTLANGNKVMPDGKVMMKDGKQMEMRDGTIIMDSGRVMHGSHAQPMMPPEHSAQE